MKKKTILWAFDPFQQNQKIIKNMLKELEALAQAGTAAVQPVYIASPAELALATSFHFPRDQRIKRAAIDACGKALAKVRRLTQLTIAPIKIIDTKSRSSTEHAKLLAQAAQKQKAWVTVVATQSKGPAQRFFLGSFAESLLFQAQTPVLLVGPRSSMKKARKIFFASDLSSQSFRALKKVLEMADAMKASISVYHAISTSPLWTASSDPLMMAESTAFLNSYRKHEVKRAERQMKRIAQVIRRAGLKVTTKVALAPGHLAEGIVNQSQKQKASWVAVSSQSTPLKAFFLGSTARAIIRRADQPVLILR
jgi:nucleotide-binding universal stress UspA family protein